MTVYEGLLKVQPMETYDFAHIIFDMARLYKSAAAIEEHLNSELSPENVEIVERALQEKQRSRD